MKFVGYFNAENNLNFANNTIRFLIIQVYFAKRIFIFIPQFLTVTLKNDLTYDQPDFFEKKKIAHI